MILNLIKSTKFFKQLRFIYHNKSFFSFKSKNDTEILIEFNHWPSLQIANSYLLKVLQDKYQSKIIAYAGYPMISTDLKKNFFQFIKWNLGSFFNFKNFGIYKSFGCSKFIWPILKKELNEKVDLYFIKLIKTIKSKKDLEKLKVEGFWVGDLIYDSYLKFYHEATVNIDSKEFRDYLKKCLKIIFFWIDYFKKKKVRAVIFSHSVYLLALPSRIAIKKNIKCYVCHGEYLYSLNKNNLFARSNFFNAKKNLSRINRKLLDLGRRVAKKRIKMRLDGKKNIDIWWAKKGSFGKSLSSKKVLSNNSNFKFLIANHSFLDSPHVHGIHLFPDFFEWINFLGKISKLSNSEWYIKLHPYEANFEKGYTKKIIKNFLEKYPNIKIIPKNTSHNQLVKEKINCVLTVVGTVAMEYAAMNIPVINASKKNPHSNFNFNIHVSNIKKYKKLLLNPKKIKIKINHNEIYDYYFHEHLLYTRDWLFENYVKMEKITGGQYKIDVYDYWIEKEISIKKHLNILNNLKKFINSGKFRLGYEYIENKSLKDDLVKKLIIK